MLTDLLQRALPIALITACLVVAGCSSGLFGTRGEGATTSETRDIPAFTRVDVSGGIGLTLADGSSGTLTVSAQANLLPIIETVVKGDTLHIKPASSYTSSAGVEVSLAVADLEGMTVSGGSRVTVADVALDALDIELSGGSVVSAGGTIERLALGLSGGSRADLDDVVATSATVDASGGSSVVVQVRDSIVGSASGLSRIEVRGHPRIDIAATGGSTIVGD